MSRVVKEQAQEVDPGILRFIAARSTPNFYIVAERLRVLLVWAPESEPTLTEISLLAPVPDLRRSCDALAAQSV